MKELSIEEKAKAYDKAIEKLRSLHDDYDTVSTLINIKEELEYIFPELKESEDELTWLTKYIEEEAYSLSIDIRDNEDRIKLKKLQMSLAWLKKQCKQEQLYIRFGEIPTNEKSKIYQGEIEIGVENGVSVYPAFKTNEGDIVLGLSLPITKTTLYTQQHLIEYDNRPCYLVKGDYVGKDTDGQYLINNINIIEKIDNYRVKEEKQDEKLPVGFYYVNSEDKKFYSDTFKYEDVILHVEKQSEKKPTWNEDDEKIYKVIIELLNSWSNGTIGGCIIPPNTDRYSNWFKLIKDRVITKPKQEWSEEDETGWTNTMIMIKECASSHYTKDSIDLVVTWLKSIKQRIEG